VDDLRTLQHSVIVVSECPYPQHARASLGCKRSRVEFETAVHKSTLFVVTVFYRANLSEAGFPGESSGMKVGRFADSADVIGPYSSRVITQTDSLQACAGAQRSVAQPEVESRMGLRIPYR